MFKEIKMMNLKNIAFSAVAIAAMTGCGDTTVTYGDSTVTITGDVITTGDTGGNTNGDTTPTSFDTILAGAKFLPQQTLSGDISTSMTLTNDTLWVLDGLAVVKPGVTLTVEPGTVIAGLAGTGDATSYMIVDKDAEINADGTADKPIIFTSMQRVEDPTNLEVGQWGGLTVIGNAAMDNQVNPYEVNTAFTAGSGQATDSSGILRHVKILNSGITMAQDKEINGLSLIGVGSGTEISNITVDYSDDDGIEIWGGTVNLTNITIEHCTDDYFDIDDGFSGTVKNLDINTTTGNAGIEMSGVTAATFDGFTITTGATQAKEGGIYFKNAGIGGHFKNGTIIHNGGQITPHGALHSNDVIDETTTSFENVAITTEIGLDFTGTSAAALEASFDDGGAAGNTITYK
mgnify:CR=1 FL=1